MGMRRRDFAQLGLAFFAGAWWLAVCGVTRLGSWYRGAASRLRRRQIPGKPLDRHEIGQPGPWKG